MLRVCVLRSIPSPRAVSLGPFSAVAGSQEGVGMSTNLIGISCFFHAAACCLLKHEVLVAAVEEERFSRRKHDAGIPKRAFNYCLEEGGLTQRRSHSYSRWLGRVGHDELLSWQWQWVGGPLSFHHSACTTHHHRLTSVLK
ncbi:MAG: carbamoyltransferase [Acidobacteria bacterium]|nr:carbamoyltransferase [Acidobacteriota bacterium]